MLIPNRLRWLRNRFGYSQATLAEMLSISRMAYTQYENGHREPGIDTLVRLANVYGVSVDFLLGRSNLSHLPPLSPQESFLLSQLDRLADDRRQMIFQTLQHELGEEIVSGILSQPIRVSYHDLCYETSDQSYPLPSHLRSKE